MLYIWPRKTRNSRQPALQIQTFLCATQIECEFYTVYYYFNRYLIFFLLLQARISGGGRPWIPMDTPRKIRPVYSSTETEVNALAYITFNESNVSVKLVKCKLFNTTIITITFFYFSSQHLFHKSLFLRKIAKK